MPLATTSQLVPVPLAVSLMIHAVLAAWLFWGGGSLERKLEKDIPIEIEVVEPPPPPTPKVVEPPKPVEPPEPVEPEPVKPEPVTPPPKPLPRARATEPLKEPPPSEPPPTETPAAEPAPGPVTNSDAPAPVVTLPSLTGPGGSGPPVAVGRPTTRRVGTGGTGTNTGGGGDSSSTGTGGPAPVSIASIKTRAQPINPDLDAGKLYPPEAKRLGIEGRIKVKLVIDETGQVTSKTLLDKLGYGLDELALQLAGTLRFKPAIDTNDRPVSSVVVWTFDFVLPE